jgi:hypothetical protein
MRERINVRVPEVRMLLFRERMRCQSCDWQAGDRLLAARDPDFILFLNDSVAFRLKAVAQFQRREPWRHTAVGQGISAMNAEKMRKLIEDCRRDLSDICQTTAVSVTGR